jgi:predicted nucleic acid-binding Zn ribbon protein
MPRRMFGDFILNEPLLAGNSFYRMKRPQALSNVLSRMLKDLGMEENAKRYEAITRWKEIVGENLAAVTVPERVSHGTLIVKVTSSVWKYELTMRKQEILGKIHQVTGSLEISDIQWK